MTVIFAAKYSGGVVVGADSRAHDHVTGHASANRMKLHQLNDRVFAAKAGYGPDADAIWQQFYELPDHEKLSVDAAGYQIRKMGAQTYVKCNARAKELGVIDPGLFILVAGLDSGLSPKIIYLNFKLGEYLDSLTCTAFGPIDTHGAANRILHEECVAGNGTIAMDHWAKRLTTECQVVAPHAIGYPLEMAFIEASGFERVTISSLSDPSVPCARKPCL
ncbi:Ntn hydrolase family protein [Aquibium oceanicum]|uniref:Proteasome subunit beta n=1 Tax=Aquibium oceanicum TaxID=1670800 RepID=A0A1L3SPW5_9HYPH|nr:hypothetical protein [Aquibium oceanicum]APH71410.1 hypothetical protein BSQ44_08545 [Aquibium oceanicum]